ncbi:MAG: LVIVD repeat-containing protein [bacterium]
MSTRQRKVMRNSTVAAAMIIGFCQLILFDSAHAQIVTNVDLLGYLPLQSPNYIADIWGYTDFTGEYALVCKFDGLAVIDVNDPYHPVVASTVPSLGADMKDVKVYQHYAYAVNEFGPLQIIDLSDPYDAQLVGAYDATFSGAHNLYINAQYAYVVGTHDPVSGEINGGINILDLSNPTDPVEVGSWQDFYVHDVYVRNDTAYASLYWEGLFTS